MKKIHSWYVMELQSPNPFWHKELISWKTVFPQTMTWGGGGSVHITFIMQFIFTIIPSAPLQIIRQYILEIGDLCHGAPHTLGLPSSLSKDQCQPGRLLYSVVVISIPSFQGLIYNHHLQTQ